MRDTKRRIGPDCKEWWSEFKDKLESMVGSYHVGGQSGIGPSHGSLTDEVQVEDLWKNSVDQRNFKYLL